MKSIVSIGLLALVLLNGCFSTTYVSKSLTPSSVKTEQKMNFFWWGLSGVGEVNVGQTCGARGAARINTQQTFMNTFLGIITLGIYAPRTAFVTCAEVGGTPS